MFDASCRATGEFAPPAARVGRPSSSLPGDWQRFQLHARGDGCRGAVEAFICDVYAQRHLATVRTFAPVLVSLSDDSGRLVAAAGYRFATEALYLERYFDAPVEHLLAPHNGAAPAREHIVEVGHLAADHAGAGRRLIVALGRHLAELQVQWVVSTLTQELRHLFVRMGVTPLVLGVADPARLGPEAQEWGTYYSHHPVVLAGHLSQAMRLLCRPPVLRKAGA